MRRYRFRLDTALRARRAQEEAARQRLGDANQRLRAAQENHAAAVAAYRAVMLSTMESDRDGYLSARAREERHAAAVEKAHRRVVEAEVQAATCYAAWVEAGKQVASLERLDDRRRREWEIEHQREEASAVDDVVASRWSRAR